MTNRHSFQRVLWTLLLCIGALLSNMTVATPREEVPATPWYGKIDWVDVINKRIAINKRVYSLPSQTPIYFKKGGGRAKIKHLGEGMGVGFNFRPPAHPDGLGEIQVIVIVSGDEELWRH